MRPTCFWHERDQPGRHQLDGPDDSAQLSLASSAIRVTRLRERSIWQVNATLGPKIVTRVGLWPPSHAFTEVVSAVVKASTRIATEVRSNVCLASDWRDVSTLRADRIEQNPVESSHVTRDVLWGPNELKLSDGGEKGKNTKPALPRRSLERVVRRVTWESAERGHASHRRGNEGAAAGKGRTEQTTNLNGAPRPRSEREQTLPPKQKGTDVPPKLNGREERLTYPSSATEAGGGDMISRKDAPRQPLFAGARG